MKKLALVLFAFLALSFDSETGAQQPRLESSAFDGLELRAIGPALMSGRIADIAIDPRRQSTWYVAAGSGGVWKTTNAGTTWTAIFEHEGSYSVGAIALDPSSPDVVWVGTGENVSGRHVGFGDGVYKSLDGGDSWANVGLHTSEHISKILVDPRDGNVVYVASEGPLWSSGGERGVYKTTDGGGSWTQSLRVSDDTGVTDLELDPRDPDVLYAAAYQRRRRIWSFMGGGPESGVYKSTNGGGSWRRLSNGLPAVDMGKIGLSVSPLDPDVVYASIEAAEKKGGFFRSTDAGEHWEKRSDYLSSGTGPHYYQEIYASPHDRDRVYQMDVWIHVTDDGGKTFTLLGEPYKHSDNHALAFDPKDPDHLLAGCDGGLYETWDHGASWRFVSNLPITQVYKLSVDNDTPFYNIYGGMQDNNAQVGPSRTSNVHGIRNEDWYNTVTGDGYAGQIDPADPNLIYSESQYGFLTRFDRRTGEQVDVQPQPAKGDPPERWNWDSPILISPHSHTRLYFGSQRLWRSDDRGDSWTPVSPDLSRGQNRYQMKLMGRVWSVDDLYDVGAMSWYGNTTSISESPLVEGLLYVGTDDGLVQVTEDGGRSWRRVDRLPGVPELAFVNEVKASVNDADTVYVLLDDHKSGDFTPYLLRSRDRGRTWTSLRSDLPDRHLAWSIVEDEVSHDLLFLGTELGIYFTVDGGAHWLKLAGGVPTIAFRDLEIQRREHDLVGASFGRGFFILDDYTPLRSASPEALARDAILFPVRAALLYEPRAPLGLREKANQGGAYFEAPNPPFGAVFTYHLGVEPKTAKETRRDAELALEKDRKDVPFPGFEALEKESVEGESTLLLEIRDGAGDVVRRVEGPKSVGFHRVAWDLRYPPPDPARLKPVEPGSLFESAPIGPYAAPGSYRVRLLKTANGTTTALGEEQAFEVRALEGSTLPAQDPTAVLNFRRHTWELQRRAFAASSSVDEALEKLQYMEKALVDAAGATTELWEGLRRIELALKDVRARLAGDPVRARLSEPRAPGILDRLAQIAGTDWHTTTGPTETERRSLDVAESELSEAKDALDGLLTTDIPELEQALNRAGAPWTPGRRPPLL
jgi:photosystem II stability/assembly factor-like uncharacterized protein